MGDMTQAQTSERELNGFQEDQLLILSLRDQVRADAEKIRALEAALHTIAFHLRRNDHIGIDGVRCTQQILDAIDAATQSPRSEAGEDK